MYLTILKSIFKGFISGVVASFLGYTKKEDVPKWDLKKALQTTLLGGITNAVIMGSGMPISDLAAKVAVWIDIPAINGVTVEFAILTGIIILTDHVVKIIIRRSDIMALWDKLKDFLSKYI